VKTRVPQTYENEISTSVVKSQSHGEACPSFLTILPLDLGKLPQAEVEKKRLRKEEQAKAKLELQKKIQGVPSSPVPLR
jgi:hypothetical protein